LPVCHHARSVAARAGAAIVPTRRRRFERVVQRIDARIVRPVLRLERCAERVELGDLGLIELELLVLVEQQLDGVLLSTSFAEGLGGASKLRPIPPAPCPPPIPPRPPPIPPPPPEYCAETAVAVTTRRTPGNARMRRGITNESLRSGAAAA
jgi:hypothetical protein